MNVVVSAAREDHALFPVARPWLDRLQRDVEPFCVPDLVWASFVRVTTNRRIFMAPSSLDEAFGFLRSVRGQPAHVSLHPGTSHLERFERVCRDGDATGELVPDAQLAALAIEHGAELVSFDRDFARFPGLRWIVPEPV